MAAHSTIGQSGSDSHAVPELRLDPTVFKRMRHASEHSEVYSEASESCGGGSSRPGGGSFGGLSLQQGKRRAPVRSMTEVRPGVANESFFVADTCRLLRESREPSPLIAPETGGSKQSSMIEEKENGVTEVSFLHRHI